ncbi:MAG: N-acetylmuramoyl-L-alanine amidase [Pseudomonadota bacterium]
MRLIPLAWLACFVVLPSPASASVVRAVAIWQGSHEARLTLELDEPARPLLSSSPSNPLVITLPGFRLATQIPQPAPVSPLIRQLTSSQPEQGLVLSLDLKVPAKVRSYFLQPNGTQGLRWVIALVADTAATPLAASTFDRHHPAARTRSPANCPTRKSPPIAHTPQPTPAKNTDTAPPRVRDVVVAVDPGHGGADPGATGPNGIQEKQVTLAIGRELVSQLNRQPGIKAFLTRQRDVFLALRARMAKARQKQADLFVSIHADAVDDKSVHGSSVYILSQKGASSEAARWLAERENSADLVNGVKLTATADQVLASVLLDMSQCATLKASQDAARQVLKALIQLDRPHHRDIQKAGFAVLKSPDVPSLLVETAYISNPGEESRLPDPDYQRSLATVLRTGLMNYFQHHAPPGTWLAEQHHPPRPAEQVATRLHSRDSHRQPGANSLKIGLVD